MKKILFAVAISVVATSANACGGFGQSPCLGTSGLSGTGSNPNSHYVQPHFNSSGTYMQGHYQTNPNNTQLDNYGTRGNYNPYTNQYGTRSPR